MLCLYRTYVWHISTHVLVFQYRFPGQEFLTFEHVTLVPYAPNLIEYDLLSDKQVF